MVPHFLHCFIQSLDNALRDSQQVTFCSVGSLKLHLGRMARDLAGAFFRRTMVPDAKRNGRFVAYSPPAAQ